MYRSRCGVALTGNLFAIAAIEIEGRARPGAWRWLQDVAARKALCNVFRFSLRGPDGDWQSEIATLSAARCELNGIAVNLWPISNEDALETWVFKRLGVPIGPISPLISPLDALVAQRRAEFGVFSKVPSEKPSKTVILAV